MIYLEELSDIVDDEGRYKTEEVSMELKVHAASESFKLT